MPFQWGVHGYPHHIFKYQQRPLLLQRPRSDTDSGQGLCKVAVIQSDFHDRGGELVENDNHLESHDLTTWLLQQPAPEESIWHTLTSVLLRHFTGQNYKHTRRERHCRQFLTSRAWRLAPRFSEYILFVRL